MVLHQSLYVFPSQADGGIDFQAADNLVLMIMPALRPSRGVDEHVLANLPINSFAQLEEDATRRGDLECCICMEKYEPEDQLRTLPCFHFMHSHCIDQWLAAHQTCPICKYQIS
jgi:hypothetical protein